MDLELDYAALTWTADEGYYPIDGARRLKCVIQRSLQNVLAKMILEGHIEDWETVTVGGGEGRLVIKGAAIENVAAE